MSILRIALGIRASWAIAMLAAAWAHGQPCSIDLGGDRTICAGESVTLQGPPGFANYLWSNGATTQDITVSAGGAYWCEVSYPSGNTVVNGDFSAGNTGFSSEFNYSLTSVQNEGIYTVGPNAAWYHNQFQGTGNGNFLIANAGYASYLNNQWDLWCQTQPTCPGQTYTISFRARTLSNALPGRIAWMMGPDMQWPDITFPAYNAGWQQFSTTWTAGPGQTSVETCMRVTSGDGIGNDMGVDDITFTGTIVLRDTVQVIVTPLPAVDLGSDLALCAGENHQLDAAVPGGSYLWQDGSTGPGMMVSAPGSYSVTVTVDGCSNSDQVNVSYVPLPVVDLGPDTLLCDGATLELSAAGPGYAYAWQDGSTASSYTVSSPGLYWAEVTANGCSARDSVVVGYKPLPAVSLGNDTAICAGATLLLAPGVPGATFLWQDGSTGPTLAVSTAGTYQVEAELDGCTAQASVQVAVTPLPVVDIGPDVQACPGATVTFDAATPGGSYLWSDGSTGPSLTTGQPGIHSVEVTVDGCSATDAAQLSHFTLHTVDLGPDRSFCAGGTAALGVDLPGASYLWSNGAVTDSITVGAAGIYWLEATLNGCAVRDSIVLTETPLPAVSLGNDTAICAGATLLLDPGLPGATFLWQDGSTGPTLAVSTAGTYQVEAELDGCTAQASVQVAVTPLPVVDIGPDVQACPGATVTFDAATPGGSYLWSDGSTGPSLTTGQPGIHSVEVTVDGCSATDAAQLSHFTLHTVDLGPDRSFCAGGSAALGVDLPGASYLWSNGAVSDSITVGAAGIYWLEATLNGCAVRDSIVLTETPLPAVSLGNDTAICAGATLLLDPGLPGATFLWQDGSTGPTLAVSTAGTYQVEAELDGCTAQASVQVAVAPLPVVDLGPDTLLCPGETLTLTAQGPGHAFLWNTGATTASILVTGPQTAFVTATDAQGCSGSDTITVSYAVPGTLSLGPDTSFCLGSSIILDAGLPGASAFLWNDGSTGPTLTAEQAGSYWATVTQGACTVSDTVVLLAHAPPSISLGNDTTLCPGQTLLLHVPPAGLQLAWQDGSQGADFLVGQAGTYWVAATNAAGCTDTAMVQVGYLNDQALDLGNDTLLCAGSTMLLDAALPGGSTQWSGASTAQTGNLLVSEPGLYIATTTVGSCAFTDSITVTTMDPPLLDLGTAVQFCAGESVELTANGASVLWDDGSTAPVRTIHQGGLYWAAVTEGACTVSDTVLVTEVALPSIDLGPDTGLCATALLPVDLSVQGGTFLWNDGSTAPVRSLPPGTWSVEVTANGCSARDSLLIHALPAPVLDLPADTSLCAGSAWTIDAAHPGATYLWSTGSTASSLLVGDAGLYSVTVDLAGCTASAAVNVSMVDLSSFTLGPDTLLCPGASLLLQIDLPGAAVLWEDGSTGHQRAIAGPGVYEAQVTLASCSAQSSLSVDYAALPPPVLGADQQLCQGDSVVLSIDPGAAQVLWSTGATGPQITATATGTYAVEVMLDGCTATDTVRLTFLDVVDRLDLGPDRTLCPDVPVLLDATTGGAASYAWNTGSQQAVLTVTRPGLYWATAMGPCVQASDTVLVVEGNCRPLVYLPNAFTPDGDGINDLFLPVVEAPVRSWTLLVFNRWGGQVFAGPDPSVGWDGTFGGAEAPMGVYVWDLHYAAVTEEGVVQVRKRGTVTLVR